MNVFFIFFKYVLAYNYKPTSNLLHLYEFTSCLIVDAVMKNSLLSEARP